MDPLRRTLTREKPERAADDDDLLGPENAYAARELGASAPILICRSPWSVCEEREAAPRGGHWTREAAARHAWELAKADEPSKVVTEERGSIVDEHLGSTVRIGCVPLRLATRVHREQPRLPHCLVSRRSDTWRTGCSVLNLPSYSRSGHSCRWHLPPASYASADSFGYIRTQTGEVGRVRSPVLICRCSASP
jgi:hypothetical protein